LQANHKQVGMRPIEIESRLDPCLLSHTGVIQVSFRLASLPSVKQPVDAARDYGVPTRKQPTGA